MRNRNPLRALAKSVKYQNLYCMAKEISSVHIFENVNDFSKIQDDFLYWLSLYNRLYTELSMKDSKYLTTQMIENDNWLDYYLIWERRKNKSKDTKDKKVVDNSSDIPSVVFVKG